MLDLWQRMFDPTALAIVGGGSLGVAAARSTGGDLKRALRALRPLFRSNPDRDAGAAESAVRQIERLADVKGIACVDRVKTENIFVRQAAARLADTSSADMFGEWAADELEKRRLRHESAAAVWRTAAEAAPSMGMIGTVVGLIGMFAAMDDANRIGPAMALAMLTTLYGLFLGTMLFGGIASRLERLAAAEREWQQGLLFRLEALARGQAHANHVWMRSCSSTVR